jgi:hypothetical protein
LNHPTSPVLTGRNIRQFGSEKFGQGLLHSRQEEWYLRQEEWYLRQEENLIEERKAFIVYILYSIQIVFKGTWQNMVYKRLLYRYIDVIDFIISIPSFVLCLEQICVEQINGAQIEPALSFEAFHGQILE